MRVLLFAQVREMIAADFVDIAVEVQGQVSPKEVIEKVILSMGD